MINNRSSTLFSFLLLFLLHCACTPSQEKGKLQVVTSITPLAYFAERIGGDAVSVSVMVPPGGNPHSYEPTPKQMAALGDASLFVKAGSGVEFELDWMPRFLSLNPGMRVCDASEGVRLMPMPQNGDAHEHHDQEAHHHEGNDPHYWMSPLNGVIMASTIRNALVLADPSHKVAYEANTVKLVSELQQLHREIEGRLAPVKNRRFLVFHPAWGYYASAFGLEQIAAEEEGKTLTPRQLGQVIEKARSSGIRVIFVSPQFSTVQAEAIARDIGGVVGTVDPLSRDYQQNLRNATGAFIEAMQ